MIKCKGDIGYKHDCYYWQVDQCVNEKPCEYKLQGTQDKRSPEPGWLKKQFDEVEKEVDKWPDWKKGESLEKKDD